MNKEDYAGIKCSAGCMFAAMNVLDTIKNSNNPQMDLTAILGFGALCAVDEDFLSVDKKSELGFLETTASLQEKALQAQKKGKM